MTIFKLKSLKLSTILLVIHLVIIAPIQAVEQKNNPEESTKPKNNIKKVDVKDILKVKKANPSTEDLKQKKKKEEEIAEKILKKNLNSSSENLLESDKDITTKIYKSSDLSNDLIDEEVNIQNSFEEDIINKDDLIKNKLTKRDLETSISSSNNTRYISTSQMLLPWIILVSFISILAVLFKILNDNKI